MNKLVQFVLLVVVVLAAILVGLPMLVQFVTEPPAVEALRPGDPVPEIRAEGWLNGEPDPQQLAGKVLVVHAWATW